MAASLVRIILQGFRVCISGGRYASGHSGGSRQGSTLDRMTCRASPGGHSTLTTATSPFSCVCLSARCGGISSSACAYSRACSGCRATTPSIKRLPTPVGSSGEEARVAPTTASSKSRICAATRLKRSGTTTSRGRVTAFTVRATTKTFRRGGRFTVSCICGTFSTATTSRLEISRPPFRAFGVLTAPYGGGAYFGVCGGLTMPSSAVCPFSSPIFTAALRGRR